MRLAILPLAAALCVAQGPGGRDLRYEAAPKNAGDAAPETNAWAVIAGVSSYRNLPPGAQLRFAHRDAEDFARFLQSREGGSFNPRQIKLLTDESATLAALRAGIGTWLPRTVQPDDVVYIFFAGHGVVDNGEAYLLAHDSDPQNLYATALSVRELEESVARVRAKHIVVFADACHSGYLGWSDMRRKKAESARRGPDANLALNKFLAEAGRAGGSTLRLLASREDERSFEDEQWGGGHGAFTYFLLEGLRGKAERNPDKVIRASEVIDFISTALPQATDAKQHPQVAGHFEAALPLALVHAVMANPVQPPVVYTPIADATESKLAGLIATGRIVEKGGAWDFYAGLPVEKRQALEPAIVQALEEVGQASISDYVQSSTPGLKRDLQLRSAEAYLRLQALRPNSAVLEGKRMFCVGRAKLLEGKPEEAVQFLQRAIQLDPKTACPYAALGAAFAALRRNDEAIELFQKAAELTPDWALPRLQLATQRREKGLLDQEIEDLKTAVDSNPKLLLAHWRLAQALRLAKRHGEAEQEALRLISRNPNYAPIYVEYGMTMTAAGRHDRAADAYEAYLQLAPNFKDAAEVRSLLMKSREAVKSQPPGAVARPKPPEPAKAPSLRRGNEKAR